MATEVPLITNILINSTTAATTIDPKVIKNLIQLERALSFRYFGIFIGIFAIVVGSLGNLLTIVAYFTTKKLRNPFHLFILHLSIVDLITASCMLPFHVSGYIMGDWPFGERNSITASLQQFNYFSCGYTSVSFLIGITMNRFIGVIMPHNYGTIFAGTNLNIILLICWLIAPVCLLPFIVGHDPLCPNGMTGFHPTQLVCTFVCLRSPTFIKYMQFTRFFFQLMPFPIMIAVYAFIFLSQIKSLNRIRKISGTRSTTSATSAGQENNEPSAMRRAEIEASQRSEKANMRLLKVSVVICAAFASTFLPSVLINMLPGRYDFDVRYHMLCSNLSWFNATVNPIVYATINPSFRTAYKRIIFQIIGREGPKEGQQPRRTSTTRRRS